MSGKFILAAAVLGAMALATTEASAQVVVSGGFSASVYAPYAPAYGYGYSRVVVAPPAVAYRPAIVAPAVTAYGPIVAPYAPVFVPRPVIVAPRPIIVARPRVYVWGQPVRNFARAVTPY